MTGTRVPMLKGAVICMTALLVVSLVGLVIDDRIITGAPAWLKPFKFCVSAIVYLLTLAWMTRPLPGTKALALAEAVTGIILVAEVAVICVQALRGTTSHFNVDTALDGALFSFMGIGIGAVWAASAVILWQHLRAPLPDRGLALAFRLGLLVHIAGAGIGWTMTRPFPGQIDAIERGERPRIIGSHTVGGRDGGPGLPITRWSTQHGDLRVPHFVGMHALQLLPLAVIVLRRLRRRETYSVERPLVLGLTFSWAALLAFVLFQALGGLPLLHGPGV